VRSCSTQTFLQADSVVPSDLNGCPYHSNARNSHKALSRQQNYVFIEKSTVRLSHQMLADSKNMARVTSFVGAGYSKVQIDGLNRPLKKSPFRISPHPHCDRSNRHKNIGAFLVNRENEQHPA
jgi:hypothetical protein